MSPANFVGDSRADATRETAARAPFATRSPAMGTYDFSAGLPDTTGMGRAEKLDVLRQYRRWKEEKPATYDFSAGPPDTSGLEGSERLGVLRSYRQWKEDGQAMSPTDRARPAAGAAGTMSAQREWIESGDDRAALVGEEHRAVSDERADVWTRPEEPAEEEPAAEGHGAVEIPPLGPAGAASARHTSHTYFERPPSARVVSPRERAPPPWIGPEPTPTKRGLAPRPMTADSGAAGLDSSCMGTKFDWLETERDHKDAEDRTDARVLGLAMDDTEALPSRAELISTLQAERIAAADTARQAAMDAPPRPVAGVASVPDPLGSYDTITLSAPTEAPLTAGMSRAKESELKRHWRRTEFGDGRAENIAETPKVPALPLGDVGGMAAGVSSISMQARSTRRADVGSPDPVAAADYNYAAGRRHCHPPPQSPKPPYCGGGENQPALINEVRTEVIIRRDESPRSHPIARAPPRRHRPRPRHAPPRRRSSRGRCRSRSRNKRAAPSSTGRRRCASIIS